MIDLEAASIILEEAAFEHQKLPDALERAGKALKFDHLFLFSMEPGRPDFLAAPEPHAKIQNYVDSGWWQVDHRTDYNRREMRPGALIRDHLTVPEAVRAKSPIYNELYIPGGWSWNSVWQFSIAGERWAFSGMRSDSLGPVSDEEAARLAQFMPVANRVAMMAVRLRDANIAGHAAGIEAAGLSAIVLDHNGRVILMTPRAEALIGKDFGIVRGALWASDSRSQKELMALAHFARGQLLSTTPPNCVIRRSNGSRPIIAHPVSVKGSALDILPGARVVIMLSDLEGIAKPTSEILRAAFGFTPREAEIATLLANGESPEAISEKLSLKIFTVRDHVKVILAKTDCHRQSELTALLGRLPQR